MLKSSLNKRAVALKYDGDERAPMVIATGMGTLAEKIVETAVEHNVPVFEDHSLATLLSRLELGEEIPEELYQAIVDIYVYFLHFTLDGNGPKAAQEGEKQEEQDSGTGGVETK